jgi:hypothetical protein
MDVQTREVLTWTLAFGHEKEDYFHLEWSF